MDNPLPESVDWPSLCVWIDLVLHRHGDRIVRMEGSLDVAGMGTVYIRTAGRILYPPKLPFDPVAPSARGLTLITDGLEAARIVASLRGFQPRKEEIKRAN